VSLSFLPFSFLFLSSANTNSWSLRLNDTGRPKNMIQENEQLEKIGSRLLERRDIDRETGCWHYTGATTGNGYGYIRYGDEMVYTHRVSAVLFLDFALASRLYVLHRCDTPTCFNPDHLFIGTAQDNAQDAVAKGRKRGGRKLTHDQVVRIKYLLQDGRTHRSIGEEYGVTTANIGQIARGETWRHVRIDELEESPG
jgi:Autographiviridae endonuclease